MQHRHAFAGSPSKTGGTLAGATRFQPYGVLAAMRDSKENLFNSNLIPDPEPFSFRPRTSRLNWRQVIATDLDQINDKVDLNALNVRMLPWPIG